MIEEDGVKVTTVVAVDCDTAFALFTEETDLWWGQGPRFRPLSHPHGRMVLEPDVGGRLIEETPEETFVLGVVTRWDPPRGFAFQMGGRDFEPDPSSWPLVEVAFEPEKAGTRITLEQSGFAALAADHPVRHGLDGDAFLSMMGLFWADLLNAAKRRAAGE